MASSPEFPTSDLSSAKMANPPPNDLFTGTTARGKEKPPFTQQNHLRDILDKVRDLAASCALYEETWTKDDENKKFIRLVGKALSVIPAEIDPDAEDLSPHVSRRNVDQPGNVQDHGRTLYEAQVKAQIQGLSWAAGDTANVPCATFSKPALKALALILSRITPANRPISNPADVIHQSVVTYKGGLPTDSGLWTYPRWIVPAWQMRNCGDGGASTVVVSATAQGKHSRWHSKESKESVAETSFFNYSKRFAPGFQTSVRDHWKVTTTSKKRSRSDGHELAQLPPKKARGSDIYLQHGTSTQAECTPKDRLTIV